MEENKEIKLKELTAEQLADLNNGKAIKDMTTMPGWKIIEGWLKSRSFHAWVDPRGLSEEDWKWAELNAYHSQDVAKEILTEVEEAIEKSNQLENYRLGKDEPNRMKI